MSHNSETPISFEGGQINVDFENGSKTWSRIFTNAEHGLEDQLHVMDPHEMDSLFGRDKENCQGVVACVDEGIAFNDDQRGCLRTAGSGILLGKDRAIELWKETGVTTVTAHEGCGAATLYCEQKGITTDNPSRFVADLLRTWAEEAGLDFVYIEKLDRPAYHNARAISVVGTPDFEPNRVAGYPKTFVVSAGESVAEAVDDVLLSAQIAFGDHGFGGRFSPEHPMLIGLIDANVDSGKLADITAALRQHEWYVQHADRIHLQTVHIVADSGAERPAA